MHAGPTKSITRRTTDVQVVLCRVLCRAARNRAVLCCAVRACICVRVCVLGLVFRVVFGGG